METPVEWPLKIRQSYDPMRILGKGGFASVVLAHPKPDTANNAAIKNNRVAIKVVGGVNESGIRLTAKEIEEQRTKAVLYARREIEILKHVKHNNIVKLYDHWVASSGDENEEKGTNDSSKDDLTAAVLVLEYAKGPTVEALLKHGGALSTIFGRIVIAQTMDAIAYLHSRAVLHRDIKPDNILVTGALSSDASIWDNPEDMDDASEIGKPSEPNWEALRSKYKVTLIDFGFARALTPDDVKKPTGESIREDLALASYHRIAVDGSYRDIKGGGSEDLGSSHRSTSSGRLRRRINKGLVDSSVHRMLGMSTHSGKSEELSKSTSHRVRRSMSAVGNRMFAAPEIINHVHPQFRERVDPNLRKSGEEATRETISNYVADYGLLVDAYSMGHTIRYMMTGVQPGISVEDAIFQQTGGPIGQLFSLCCGKKSGSENQKRSVRYRHMDELSRDILRLVGALTQMSEQKRLSIRKARTSVPWITEVLQPQTDEKQKQEPPSDKISHLPFATDDNAAEPTKRTLITASEIAEFEESIPQESALTF